MIRYLKITIGILIFAIFWLTSCINLPTEATALPELLAQIRFIQTDPSAENGEIEIDNEVMADLSYGDSTDYMTIPAGNRILKFKNEIPETLFVDTDFKGTIYSLPLVEADQKRFVKNKEGWIYSASPAAHLTKIVVAQMIPDTLYISVQGIDSYEMALGTTRSATLTQGLIRLTVSTSTTLVDSVQYNFSGGSSHTVVIMGQTDNPVIRVYSNR